MQLANQLELYLHKQTQIVASAACIVGSQEFHSWIASLPLVSLLFIVIPTPFLKFYLLLLAWIQKNKNKQFVQLGQGPLKISISCDLPIIVQYELCLCCLVNALLQHLDKVA